MPKTSGTSEGNADRERGRWTVQRLGAYEEIRQLAYRYAWLLDCRDIDKLVELFVEDVDRGGAVRGREALRESFSGQLARLGPTALFVGNHIIDVADDLASATGIVYCRGYISDPVGFIEQMIVYTDRYRCCDDGVWRFVGRRHELMYGITTSERPYEQEPANWPDRQIGIGSLPFRLESWQAFQQNP